MVRLVTSPDRCDLVMTYRVFSYGTLRQQGVQCALYGRDVPTVADALPGHQIDWLVITDPDVIQTSRSDRHPTLRASGTANPPDAWYAVPESPY
jgi:hypothetical protein